MHPTQHSTIRQPWPRAKDHSTHNPTVQQRRVSELVKASADHLQRIGMQNRMRSVQLEHSTGEAA